MLRAWVNVVGESAAAQKEAVQLAVAVTITPDDLAHIVDADTKGICGQRIVEGGVGIDWHDPCSSVIVALAESLNWKAYTESLKS
jgi:hypothetical protein